MKKRIMRLFRRDKSLLIVIKFTPQPDGKCNVRTETGHNVPVTHALDALDKLRWNISASLSNKAKIQGLDSNNPRTRTFMKKQRLGDLR